MAFLGIEDKEFIRGEIPMTKQEIRVLTLAKAHIQPTAVIIDIGAGTGSISIEAALLAPKGHVYSIERTAEGIKLIQANAEKFGVHNLTAVHSEAPDGLEKIDTCDTVIIGGSGRQLDGILDVVSPRLAPEGRIVLNCITIQTLSSCLEYMRKHTRQFTYEAIQIQVNRLEAVGPYDMAKAINPIYIVTCIKKNA